ncbi:MAG: hypothetical protein JRN67_00500 [Nitrososphaerota archaeon]|nr:hypothetical protein [Nitrososphaerota archaeon]
MTELFNLVCMQAKSKWIGDGKKAREIIKENMQRHLQMMDMLPYGAAPVGVYPKVVVYPEFSLQGLPCSDWAGNDWLNWLRDVAVEIPGDVTDAFGRKSAEKGCYVQACVWDKDTKFGPDVYFESVFITDPKGNVVYVRRRNNLGSIFGPAVTPDVFDEYVKKYGPDPVDALFPVLRTPYGVFGGIMCCEMSTPEISRALSMNGAEILLHSTSEPNIHNGSAIQGNHFRDMERPVRAADNCVYLASANIGQTLEGGAPLPEHRDRGRSEILDWRGNRLARIEGAGEAIATAPIDIDAIRKVRRKWAFGHLSSQSFAPVYQRETWPLNRLPKSDAEATQIREDVVKKLVQKGRLTE